jgi:hypothetical protein
MTTTETLYCCALYGGHICYLALGHDGPHICQEHACAASWEDGQDD